MHQPSCAKSSCQLSRVKDSERPPSAMPGVCGGGSLASAVLGLGARLGAGAAEGAGVEVSDGGTRGEGAGDGDTDGA